MSRTIVTLRNPEDHALHCILEQPPGGSAHAPAAAVFLCPGIKTRVGPHRLYRKLSAPFLARGIPVLRVDFRGLGDSEGNWPDDSLATIYHLTELGHCVEDARSALDWLETHLGIRRCIVGGLCGAAITALDLAREDPRVAALHAVGFPSLLQSDGDEHSMSEGELRSHRARYLRKLAQPSSWLRLLSLRSDYGLLWRTLCEELPTKMGYVPISSNTASAGDLNPDLPAGLLTLMRTGRRAFILFGEHDPMRFQFEERFLHPWSAALKPYESQICYSVVPNANHSLADPAAVGTANRLTEAWLDAQLTRWIGRLEGGPGAAGIHPRAIECSPTPEAVHCSTSEF